MTEEQLTEEPKRMYSLVRDADGHIWQRGRTIWSCTAPIGTRYYSRVKRRPMVVESVGRLPWHALARMYGPLTLVREGKG